MRQTIFSDDKIGASDTHTDFEARIVIGAGSGPHKRFRIRNYSLQKYASGAWAETTDQFVIELRGISILNNYQTFSSTESGKSNIIFLANNRAGSLPSGWLKIPPLVEGITTCKFRLLERKTLNPLQSKADESSPSEGDYAYLQLELEFEEEPELKL